MYAALSRLTCDTLHRLVEMQQRGRDQQRCSLIRLHYPLDVVGMDVHLLVEELINKTAPLDIGWNRQVASCGSSVTDVICFHISWIISIASRFHEPTISMAIGVKICQQVMLTYYYYNYFYYYYYYYYYNFIFIFKYFLL